MTDCDVPDSALQEVASVALAHLPNGSQAWVERGLGGLPHRLYVRPAWLDAEASVAWPEGHPEPLRSCEFYDRLAPVRWLGAAVEGAAIALRGHLAYLERREVGPDALKAVAARLALLRTLAGGLSALRHRLEREGAALGRVEIPRSTISDETMREIGVSPMGEATAWSSVPCDDLVAIVREDVVEGVLHRADGSILDRNKVRFDERGRVIAADAMTIGPVRSVSYRESPFVQALPVDPGAFGPPKG